MIRSAPSSGIERGSGPRNLRDRHLRHLNVRRVPPVPGTGPFEDGAEVADRFRVGQGRLPGLFSMTFGTIAGKASLKG